MPFIQNFTKNLVLTKSSSPKLYEVSCTVVIAYLCMCITPSNCVWYTLGHLKHELWVVTNEKACLCWTSETTSCFSGKKHKLARAFRVKYDQNYGLLCFHTDQSGNCSTAGTFGLEKTDRGVRCSKHKAKIRRPQASLSIFSPLINIWKC